MKIGNENHMQNTSVLHGQQGVKEVTSQNEQHQLASQQTSTNRANQLTLSDEGKLFQELDSTSDRIDSILERHLSPEQKEQLNSLYKKLDSLFEKEQLSQQEEAVAEDLHEQVHNILESSVDKLSDEEYQELEGLADKMDTLTAKLDQFEMGTTENNSELILPTNNESQGSKKKLTVAELNMLSASELNKLPVNELRKLNAKQLNRLNANQLNSLSLAQLKQLNPSNIDKLNQSQLSKLLSN